MDHYEWASSSFESGVRNEAKLDESYNNILERQERYGVNLVNNPAFRDWVLSDWDLSW